MLNEILGAIAPIAKDVVEAYVYSAITDDYNPKKSDNPYSADSIMRSTIRNYDQLSQMDPNNQGDNPRIHITYKGGGDSLSTISSETEKTPYTLAMKKEYKYKF